MYGLGARRPIDYSGQVATTITRFCGHNFQLLLSGAAYWPAERTLLVADLHLEKMSSYAPRGQLLPPYDSGLTLKRLAADLDATGAETVLSLGDSFHRDSGSATLLDADRLRLDALMEATDWIWLAGNHDPRPHALGGRCLPFLERRGLVFTHQPRAGQPGLVAGHLHPAARVYLDGRSVRRPCFVHDNKLMLLPAYGSGTGSINILSAPFAGLFDWGGLEVTMLGRDQLYPVGPRRLVGG